MLAVGIVLLAGFAVSGSNQRRPGAVGGEAISEVSAVEKNAKIPEIPEEKRKEAVAKVSAVEYNAKIPVEKNAKIPVIPEEQGKGGQEGVLGTSGKRREVVSAIITEVQR
eukprot:Hpha_TRINITY_DN6925_c0_g1::TRINITY_DN6925_c0_g1_i1::g.139583::m.139583